MMIEISRSELETYSDVLRDAVLKMAIRNKPSYIRIDSKILGTLIRAHQPKLIQKMTNLALEAKNQMKAVINGEELKAKEEEVARRLSLCTGCHFFNPMEIACMHNNCGCALNRKTILLTARCPIGRW